MPFQLRAIVRDLNNVEIPDSPVTWETSNAQIAVVSQTGLVTGLGNGSVTITARSSIVTSVFGTSTGTVNASSIVNSIVISPSPFSALVGGTVQLTATVRDQDTNPMPGEGVTWSSSNPSIISVTSLGVTTAHAEGSAVITATSITNNAVTSTSTGTVTASITFLRSDAATNYALDANLRANISSNLSTFSNPALKGTGSPGASLYSDGYNVDLFGLDNTVLWNGDKTFKYTFPPSASAAPALIISLGGQYGKVWMKQRVRFAPGFTTAGNGTGGAASYKIGMHGTYSGSEGRADIEYTNINQYDMSAYPLTGGSVAVTENRLVTGVNETTAWNDGQWYEIITLYERIDANNGRWRGWKGLENGTKIPIGDQFTQALPNFLIPYLNGTAISLNYNRVRTSGQTFSLNKGPWEAVNATSFADPYNLINGALTPSFTVPTPTLSIISQNETDFTISVPIPNPAPAYIRFYEGLSVCLPNTGGWSAINPSWAGTTRHFNVSRTVWAPSSSHTIRAQFGIDLTGYSQTVKYVGSTSNAVTGTLGTSLDNPAISSITPAQGEPGETFNVVIAGLNFDNNCTVNFSGTGITINSTTINSLIQITCNITIDGGAATTQRIVKVVSSINGDSNEVAFNVIDNGPFITSLAPDAMQQGTTGNVIVAGDNFATDSVVNISGTGITVNSTTRNTSQQITTNLTISGVAAATVRDFKITSVTDGDSNIVPFTVNTPVSTPQLTSIGNGRKYGWTADMAATDAEMRNLFSYGNTAGTAPAWFGLYPTNTRITRVTGVPTYGTVANIDIDLLMEGAVNAMTSDAAYIRVVEKTVNYTNALFPNSIRARLAQAGTPASGYNFMYLNTQSQVYVAGSVMGEGFDNIPEADWNIIDYNGDFHEKIFFFGKNANNTWTGRAWINVPGSTRVLAGEATSANPDPAFLINMFTYGGNSITEPTASRQVWMFELIEARDGVGNIRPVTILGT